MWLPSLLLAAQTLWQTQTLDHFHIPVLEAGQFQQRFWELIHPDQPESVFLLLCGQTDCMDNPPDYDYAVTLANEHNAVVYLLEHRLYGASLPYGQMSMLPQYLETMDSDQILADIVQFIQDRELSLPWVLVGSGYAGALAAWARTKYPDLITAAWASSAPVNSLLDYTGYDQVLYTSLNTKSKKCSRTVQQMTAYADDLFASGTVIPELTDLLNATASFQETPDGRPALWYLADLVGKLVGLGHADELCTTLGASTSAQESVSLILSLGASYGLDVPANYGVNPLNSVIWWPDSVIRQQYWQSCTQLGLFPVASTGHMVSTHLDLHFWGWYCNVVFGYPGGLPLPDVNKRNARNNWRGSRIIFTNGIEDPWYLASELSSDQSQQRISVLADCSGCSFSSDMKAGAQSDPAELKQQRDTIRTMLAQWLA